VITSLSMAGVPPFNGFLSKEKFLEAVIELTHAHVMSLNTLGVIFPILAIVGSIFTFVYSIKFIMHIFFGEYKPNQLPQQAHEASILMLISPSILAILVIILGLFPGILTQSIIEPATTSMSQTTQVNAEFHL
ncbi:Na+/H+ antiporter subunit A, partial [Vibrio vulnificus]